MKSLFHQIRNIVENPCQIKSLTDSEKANAWESTVSGILSSNQPLDPKPHDLPGPLIISLTSYAPRFPTLPLTLRCLLSQTMKPDKIMLWIAHEDKDNLTSEILTLRTSGLEIEFCSDIGSYKKIIPTLQNYPDHFIITADDDIYYWPTWIEELITSWSDRKQDIVAHIVHRINLSDNQLPLEYHKWKLDYTNAYDPSPLNFATGAGGVLYPPKIFHHDILDIHAFQSLCKNADDVWLYWMSSLNGSMVRRTLSKRKIQSWPSTQEKGLYRYNVIHGNDNAIKAMIKTYGFPGKA